MRKISRKGLVKKLDKVVSQTVIARDKRCVTCWSTEKLTCGHLFSRTAYSTRWDLLNCHCQCWGCNYSHEFDPYPYTKWFIDKYGMETYDDLHRAFRTIGKFKDWELEILYNTLVQTKENYETR